MINDSILKVVICNWKSLLLKRIDELPPCFQLGEVKLKIERASAKIKNKQKSSEL
jgi:hypothetical protein